MRIEGSVVLVTGADRGLGKAYARELINRRAAKVLGAAPTQAPVEERGLLPVELDVTDEERVAEVSRQCGDVNLLANNARHVSCTMTGESN